MTPASREPLPLARFVSNALFDDVVTCGLQTPHPCPPVLRPVLERLPKRTMSVKHRNDQDALSLDKVDEAI
jgi:hypothetical protein